MPSDDADVMLLHERVLVDRARHGDHIAFVELHRRQVPASWRLAFAISRDPDPAAGALADGFAAVLGTAGRERADRHAPLQTQLLTAVRHAAVDHLLATGRTTSPSWLAAPPAPGDTAVALEAFESLPELWRSVLWITDVEGLDDRHAGMVLGVSAHVVPQLAARARGGLRERFVQSQITLATNLACRDTLERLHRYASDSLSPRDTSRVRRHLDRCDSCRGRLLAVDDLMARVRRTFPPAPALLVAEAERRWAATIVPTRGPLHLTLPGGRAAPAWAERALAGTVAGVVTLGIVSAILSGGRDRSRDDRLSRQAASDEPFGTEDGEQALGDGSNLPVVVLDDPPPALTSGRTGTTAPSGPAIGSALALDADRRPASLPSDQGTTSEPPDGPPVVSDPPTPPPPPPPRDPDDESQLEVGIEGVAGVVIGEDCTGVQVLGTPLLCDPDNVESSTALDLGDAIDQLTNPLGL